MQNNAKHKIEQLGMSEGKARRRLEKKFIFMLIEKAGMNVCYKCLKPMTADTYSVEHKKEWLYSEDPVNAYFDMANIAFSHRKCNRGTRGMVRKSRGTIYKGIFKINDDKRSKLWRANVYVNGKRHYVGSYATDKEAAIAYDEAAVKLLGDRCITNKALHLLP